jgi:hypothetical protein
MKNPWLPVLFLVFSCSIPVSAQDDPSNFECELTLTGAGACDARRPPPFVTLPLPTHAAPPAPLAVHLDIQIWTTPVGGEPTFFSVSYGGQDLASTYPVSWYIDDQEPYIELPAFSRYQTFADGPHQVQAAIRDQNNNEIWGTFTLDVTISYDPRSAPYLRVITAPSSQSFEPARTVIGFTGAGGNTGFIYDICQLANVPLVSCYAASTSKFTSSVDFPTNSQDPTAINSIANAVKFAYQKWQTTRDSVILIGYSMGGYAAWETARQLADAGIPVKYLGTIDIMAWGPPSKLLPIPYNLPSNISYARNIFESYQGCWTPVGSDCWNGGFVVGARNYAVSTRPCILHFINSETGKEDCGPINHNNISIYDPVLQLIANDIKSLP